MTEIDIQRIPAYQKSRRVIGELYNNSIHGSPVIEKNTRRMKRCGTCKGFYRKEHIAIIKLMSQVKKTDTILLETIDGLFEQKAMLMQIRCNKFSNGVLERTVLLKTGETPLLGGTVYRVVS